ncbi:hypothetical protein [Blastococcus sp. TF02A-30]|uniref:hypothetical protein n=1 Tax=Blastococcus sp. TF02A-30 TaxID=2250580 RepID=UPI000DE89738|nr:hypothetical protein [Blastococcus sp. TF02A-30]
MLIAAAPLGLVVAVWSETAGAERAWHSLEVARRERTVGIHAAATLVVSRDGSLRTIDVKRPDAVRPTAGGAVLAAGVEMLIGGIGWLVLEPGVDGALAAEAHQHGFATDGIRDLGERMVRRSSAMVTVVEPCSVDRVRSVFAETGARTAQGVLEPELVARLDAASAPSRDVSGAVGRVLALRSGAVVMRAMESAPAGMA